MKTIPEIFIASSTEGNAASNALETELKARVGEGINIRHWTNQFLLSSTYIESLEIAVKQCDFGIFVLTADDLISFREKENKAPRDNVIFELGLFIGGIGRSRCFIFVEKTDDKAVKTPSDLLGVETQEFTRPADGNWKDILNRGCSRVLEQVVAGGKRYRLPDSVKDYIQFRQKIIGYWWNREYKEGDQVAAFVEILADDAYNSIRLEGVSYAANGEDRSRWHSELADLVPDKSQLVYHWKGIHTEEPNIHYSGYGKIDFKSPDDAGNFLRANSIFFDVNESQMKKSTVKLRSFIREKDDKIITTMLNGTEKDKAAILAATGDQP